MGDPADRTDTAEPATDVAAAYPDRPAQYTPVEASKKRGRVHAVAFETSERAACGRRVPETGWRVSLRVVNCRDCALAVGLDARPRGRRGRKK